MADWSSSLANDPYPLYPDSNQDTGFGKSEKLLQSEK